MFAHLKGEEQNLSAEGLNWMNNFRLVVYVDNRQHELNIKK